MTNFLTFQIVIDLFRATIGAGICYGALKWKRGLIASTSIYWGLFIGLLISLFLDVEIEVLAISCFIGAIVFPILTFTVPGINRFVLGYLVGYKLCFMLMTVLLKERIIDANYLFSVPLLVGVSVGLCLMAWTKIKVSAFVLCCAFIGASEIAPIISEWINRIAFSITGDYRFLIDPIDILFALFKIELTDIWSLLSMVILMGISIYTQIKRLKDNNIPLNTPIIGFDVPREDNGKIYIRK